MSTNADVERLALSKLTGQLESGATGTLSVGKGALELSISVHKGAILGATCADDETRLLRRLELQGSLSSKTASELSALVDLDEPVMGQLLETVDYDTLAAVLRERFEDCLSRFVDESSKPRFKKAKVVWPTNVQLVAEPEPLLAKCLKDTERAARLPLDAELTPGTLAAEGANAKAALAAVEAAGGPVKVLHVLADLPLESVKGRILLGDLVIAGVLESTSLEAADGGLELGDIDAEPATEEVGEEGQHEHMPITSLHDWMGQSELVDSDELEAFADNESDRSAGSEGSFSTAEHNLDKVDVDGDAPAAEEAEPEDEELAAGEAPSQKFSAPPLSEEDAGAKVEVANESLRAIAIAVDKVNGSGAGRSAVRLLVEGVPQKFQALFTNIAPNEDGSVGVDDILDNLYTRPATEHRALLSQGLIDLIERGIEAVADDLPDEEFDTMYEACAGYRQKLGL